MKLADFAYEYLPLVNRTHISDTLHSSKYCFILSQICVYIFDPMDLRVFTSFSLNMCRLSCDKMWCAYDVIICLFHNDNVSFIYIERDTDSHAEVYRFALCSFLHRAVA